MRFILTLAVCLFICFGAEAKVIKANTFAEAIHQSNIISGKDSLYLSDFNLREIESRQYNISDQLVLINDLGDQENLLRKETLFKVAITGSLQLVGFDIAKSKSKIVNLGKVSLENCTFQEGKDLTQNIRNKGLFVIKNGIFEGSSDGIIIRDAHFKVGAAVIL